MDYYEYDSIKAHFNTMSNLGFDMGKLVDQVRKDSDIITNLDTRLNNTTLDMFKLMDDVRILKDLIQPNPVLVQDMDSQPMQQNENAQIPEPTNLVPITFNSPATNPFRSG